MEGGHVNMTPKEDALKNNGSFNKRFKNVRAEVFQNEQFFDAKDLVQVKYEMLRSVAKDDSSVSKAADEFGFSRNAFYQINEAFNKDGLKALLPKKPGPTGPSKLRNDVSDFIDKCLTSQCRVNAKEIASKLLSELGIRIHPRTIERFIEKKTATVKNP
jgi:transposase